MSGVPIDGTLVMVAATLCDAGLWANYGDTPRPRPSPPRDHVVSAKPLGKRAKRRARGRSA